MTNKSRISILLPVLNGEQYIAQAIESVLAQDVNDWELVISDNASTDHTIDIVSRYRDSRIRLLRSTVRLSASANWNRTIQEATGGYCVLLGFDDLLVPTGVRLLRDEISRHPDADLYLFDVEIIDSSGLPIKRWKHSSELAKDNRFAAQVRTNCVNIAGACWKRTGDRFSLRYELLFDWDFFLRVMSRTSSVVLVENCNFMKYRIHGNSTSSKTKNSEDWIIDSLKVWNVGLRTKRNGVYALSFLARQNLRGRGLVIVVKRAMKLATARRFGAALEFARRATAALLDCRHSG